MIYYFSGTGNSLIVCKLLAEELQDEYSSITSLKRCKDANVGIVFPVYAWGVPKIVENFIINILPTVLEQKDCYFYIVMTCGDDVGFTDKLVSKAMNKIGIRLDSAFSVQMPNTYISLPGFDVDSEILTQKKVQIMKKNICSIAKSIINREEVINVTRGGMAWVKSYLIRPLFHKYFMNDKRFWVEKTCVHCGKCASYCPVYNIEMKRYGATFLPSWKGNCVGCLGCYHICQQHAIQYGYFTKNKGQKAIFK